MAAGFGAYFTRSDASPAGPRGSPNATMPDSTILAPGGNEPQLFSKTFSAVESHSLTHAIRYWPNSFGKG